MPLVKFTTEHLYRIKTFLELRWSFTVIQRKLKEEGISISRGYLSKLKTAEDRRAPSKRVKGKRRGKLRRLSTVQQATLRKLLNQTNPPSQRNLAKRFRCCQSTIRYAIKKFGKRLVKKPKGHVLTADTIEKRRRRSWPLYLRLRGDRWKFVATCDEAWIYLSDTGRRRSVQYVSRKGRRSSAEVSVHVANPRGVMVWAALSANGVSRPIFIEPGAKINATYYQEKVLKPFFAKDAKKLYPNGVFLFHQDSAPSHKAASTIQWLNSHNVAFITPQQWMPSSPDASPCDYFLWGYLKAQLNKKTPRSIEALKRAIAAEMKKIPLDMIQRALRAWPRRCREIRYARGGHIEQFRH